MGSSSSSKQSRSSSSIAATAAWQQQQQQQQDHHHHHHHHCRWDTSAHGVAGLGAAGRKVHISACGDGSRSRPGHGALSGHRAHRRRSATQHGSTCGQRASPQPERAGWQRGPPSRSRHRRPAACVCSLGGVARERCLWGAARATGRQGRGQTERQKERETQGEWETASAGSGSSSRVSPGDLVSLCSGETLVVAVVSVISRRSRRCAAVECTSKRRARDGAGPHTPPQDMTHTCTAAPLAASATCIWGAGRRIKLRPNFCPSSSVHTLLRNGSWLPACHTGWAPQQTEFVGAPPALCLPHWAVRASTAAHPGCGTTSTLLWLSAPVLRRASNVRSPPRADRHLASYSAADGLTGDGAALVTTAAS